MNDIKVCKYCGNLEHEGAVKCSKCGGYIGDYGEPVRNQPRQQNQNVVMQQAPVHNQRPVDINRQVNYQPNNNYNNPPRQNVAQQQNYQSIQNQANYMPAKGLGIASMVLGIVSLVFVWVYVGIVTAIVGVSLGGVALSKAKKENGKNGFAVAGVACSCVSLGLYALVVIIVGSVAGSLWGMLF
ncbi:MAG: DUF4190 domain-containing protein [Eubacterium sp.]